LLLFKSHGAIEKHDLAGKREKPRGNKLYVWKRFKKAHTDTFFFEQAKLKLS